ncbi:MAG TPA: PP2C family protein-serine/threonine phosphatase [Solirubrobacteraceae bacterium]|nr:PP2C family protein-serine/threonine phosphatase [Solirubrobacteraceae bacterium]
MGSIATAGAGFASADSRSANTSGKTRSAGHASNPLDTIGAHIPLPLPVPDWSKPIIALLLVLVIGFAIRSGTAGRRARRLEGQQATLLRDVDAMQAALVPKVPARVGGLSVSVAYRPADGPAAGGDFYDVFVPERGKIAIILGDVVGHGHGALTHAALTRYTLRAYLQTGMEPRAALALAGRVLADRSLENFATVAVAVYHAREGRLVYASAGHPPPLLHGLQTREPLAMCASPPIGWNVPTGRRQTTVSLPPGAVACFFTDGLIEARCKEMRLLGRRRLSEILAALGPRPDAEKLLAKVRATALSTPDDMAACIVVPEMTVVPGRTHVEELEADSQELDRGDVRRFLETCQVLNPAIDRALDRAGDLMAVFGTAVLRVELLPHGAAVTVGPPRPIAGADASHDSPQPVGDPSGAR